MIRSLEIGRGWRTFKVATYYAKWPTVRGENPPQGVPYRCLEVSYGSRCLELRLWNWRKRRDLHLTAEEASRTDGWTLPNQGGAK